MVLNIRNPEADRLARRLAELDKVSITDAVIAALNEAIKARVVRETGGETARRILEKHGLAFAPGREPIPAKAYHKLDRGPKDQD